MKRIIVSIAAALAILVLLPACTQNVNPADPSADVSPDSEATAPEGDPSDPDAVPPEENPDAPESPEPPSGVTEADGYKFTAPENWTASEMTSAPGYTLVNEALAAKSVVFVITKNSEAGASLPNFTADEFKKQFSALSGMTAVSYDNLKIAGSDAIKMVATYTQNGVVLNVYAYLIQAGPDLIQAYGTCVPEAAPEALPAFESIVSSISITQQ
ncbi:hypothetical protein FACS1894171_2180 [Clostridia bacterium]|nr:hypothetical protein FACS1894171_2180 [Clostridia bacterium]